ncbi:MULTISPECIES: 3D-(3,5/4)-trihydroxycyclohexane-1,2-dione acylhydrolase (decyclizing) [Mammaliicoccus]|uniref:3D-(3,5/4)-trihydroxycyclohexane-1,2-dione acylhydrolase (decyclizing) n=1 Tax=Mammaliicoccus TaxID=2803850 RepID=UPI0009930C7A|nr:MULTISPECIES: 3D-(3,5/4)-trihydroxycyclohexane-1,2-dione acylhydrolase (decyclizing) [Mammaliicoccus]MEB7781386.1 3D-(3,5/4)-trihydroxycyclohexane-1,2-dione acylhydrolase (decyclizing) [Mammaliicoccus fleurettii]OOV76402.1 3D-(3,5/4)-trihydroxycyclohexane-1,2-dione acylhydrolase (decyclizing) [Mammaliicoccus fleurettii]
MVNTVKLTTGEAIVKFLTKQYISIDGEETKFVEGVMNIFGHGNVLGIGEGLSNYQDDLKIIQGKNEQGMAHTAIGFSKQSLRKKIFAVTTSVGPGSANLVTAAGTAAANHIPVLFLPGDTFATRQPDPVLQQIENPQSIGITTNDALKPVSRYFDRITRPEQIMSALIRAFEVMTNPQTAGPVTIALSQDVQGEAFDFPESFFEKRVHYVDRLEPSERAIKAAIETLKQAKQPLLIVGGGAKYSEAQEIIKKLMDETNIPMAETQAGKSTIEASHPLNLGGLGVTGNLAANVYAKDADVIIGIGTRYSDFTTSSKTVINFDKAKVININVNRVDAYKLDAVQVVGDAKVSVKQIADNLEGHQFNTLEVVKRVKQQWDEERTRLSQIDIHKDNFEAEIAGHFDPKKLNQYTTSLNTELPQTNALIKVNETIDKDAIIVAAAGSLPGDLERLWDTDVFNTYNMEYGYSTMGYEIGAAVGAKIANPDREVYALVGDGSFLMLHTELVTALQYNYKINIVLFDNSGFGCINNLQMGNGSASFCTEFNDYNGNVMNIDYKKIAEGYGAVSYSVNNLESLEAAIRQAKQETKSTLIEIKTLPKTMTDGYESFWNVGVSEHSDKPSIQEAFKEKTLSMKTAKHY